MDPTKKSNILKAAATKGPATEATTSSTKKRKRTSKKGNPAKDASSDAGSDYEAAISPPKKKKGAPAATVDNAVKAPTVEWSLDPTLTDTLLDYFEDPKNQASRIALKFSRGEGSGKTDGRNQRQHLEDVAKVVLIEHESGLWAAYAPKDVYLTIKNRLGRMRDIYRDWRTRLDGTGQGLAEDDPSGYANLIEQRDTECPYYARLHDLLRDDLSIDKSAVVNSRTIKGSDLLRNKKKSEAEDEMEESDGLVKVGSNDGDEEERPIAAKSVVPGRVEFFVPDTQSDESGIEDQPARSTSSHASGRSEISTKSKLSTKSGMSHCAKGMFGAVSELMNEANDTRMDQEAEIIARQFRPKKEITKIEVEGRLKVARLEAESKERLETKRMELEMKQMEMEHERKMAGIKGRDNREWDGHYNPAAPSPSSSTMIAPQYAEMDLSAFGGYGGSFPGSSNMNK